MSISDWLIIAGVIVVLAILVDVGRRMRGRSELRLEIDPDLVGLVDVRNNELPNGGARIVRQADSEHVGR